MAKKSRTKDDSVQVGVRLPSELVKRLDEYIKQFEAKNAGVNFSMSSAVRVLLTKALDQEGSS